MKKFLIMLLAALLVIGAAACSSEPGGNTPESEEKEQQEAAKHKIAVLVYNRTDDEVLSFKNYLEGYIAPIFDVEFLYSESIGSQEEAMAFLEDAAEFGAEGVMSFNTYDLKKEVDLCAQKGMYFMLASGTVTDEEFESVADNEYFVGEIGPGDEMEYTAGVNLAQAGLGLRNGKESYFILSGGGFVGNEMHRLRTIGLIEAFESAYGVKLSTTAEELAVSDQIVEIEEKDLRLCICPGYPTMDEEMEKAIDKYKNGDYDIVLSVLPATRLIPSLKDSRLAVIDCYSDTNERLFANGQMSYVTGKYSSIIGPSFAAMYNAITGHAEEFRDDGRAFHIRQGFWSSDSREDYEAKFSMASSIEKVAYNYEDLQNVMKEFNEDATYDDLKNLAEAYKYEDAVARRAE